MKPILLAIPSRNRADLIQTTVLPWLDKCTFENFDARFYVEQSEFDDYEYALAGSFPQSVGITVLPKENQGLQYSLNHIYESNPGYSLVLKMDDDTCAWCCRTKRSEVVASALNFELMLTACIKKFDQFPRLGGIGFPYSHEMYELNEWVSINARLQSNYLVRARFMATPYDKVFEWDDFYRYLQILSHNYFTLRYGMVGIDGDVGGLPGGAQDFNRKVRASRTRMFFQRLWPLLEWKQVDKPWEIEPDFRATPNLKSIGINNLDTFGAE